MQRPSPSPSLPPGSHKVPHGLRATRALLVLATLTLVMVTTCLVALALGPRSTAGAQGVDVVATITRIFERGLLTTLTAAWHGEFANTEELVLLYVRPLRVSLALVAGASLAAAGTGYQAILRNPLADPFVLGVSGGASLAVAFAHLGSPLTMAASDTGLSVGGTLPVLPLFAFLGALCSTAAVLWGASRLGGWASERLILVGVIVNAICSASILMITTMLPFGRLPGLAFWLMGLIDEKRCDFALVGCSGLLALAAVTWLSLRARELNALAFGEATAATVGINPRKARRRAFIAASLLTAAAVSLAGPIGFVGLIVPHALRIVLGPDNRLLIPSSFLAGGAFLVLADTLARISVPGTEIPVGAVTALLGGPVFLVLMARSVHSHSTMS